ncbi:MAG: hypothetical protein ACE5EX_03640 [Phycisphaerae bacterium]
MRAEEIRKHLRKEPFRLIRVFLSDGSSHDVRHPEMMYVTRSEVVIAMDAGNDTIPEQSVYCDPVHTTRIEPLNGEDRKGVREQPE